MPLPVKKRATSSPLSARSAISSAVNGSGGSVFFSSLIFYPLCAFQSVGTGHSGNNRAYRDLHHAPNARRRIVFLKGMKKALQIVAIALVAVLTAQPALAGLTCGMTPSKAMPCVPKCDMAMHHMGANCPMHHHDTGTGCLQDCCRHGWPPALVQSASKTRLKTSGTPFLLAVPGPVLASAATFAPAPPEKIVAAAPDRHILLQVFRI